MGRADDDFGAGGGDADFAAAVALFGEFAGKEFVELSEEDAVRDELLSALVQEVGRAKIFLPLGGSNEHGIWDKGIKVEGNQSRYLSFLRDRAWLRHGN